MTGRRVVVVAVLIGSSIAGCARPQAPRGGAIPDAPLRVIEALPANLSVTETFEGPVTLRFGQTVSERLTQGAPRDAVIVSPMPGEVEVQVSGETIEISMAGGFPAGAVYQITVLPRFQGRFQNRMAGPFNLFFSTGPALEPNLVAGLVSDRLTLEPVEEARIDATQEDRGVVRTVVTDSVGIFTAPYLSGGVYTFIAYEDSNRDGEPGFNETQDSVSVTLALGDTLVITDIELLAPDTTAAVLGELEALDSLTVLATLDDYLDPNEPLDGVEAAASSEEGEPIEVVEVIHRWEWDERQAAASAAAVDPDSALADPPDPLAPPDAEAAPVLPAREIILVLGNPPTPEAIYQMEIQGVRNIRGLPGGGGSEELVWTPAPPPPPVPTPDPDAPDDPDAVDPDALDPDAADPDAADPDVVDLDTADPPDGGGGDVQPDPAPVPGL